MTRPWRLLLAGLVAYLLFLVTSFPAERAARLIEAQADGLSLHSVTGTIFTGHAEQFQLRGMNLGPLDWRMKPLPLMLGRLEYFIELTDLDNRIQGKLGRTLTGRLYGRDIAGELAPGILIEYFSPVAVQTTGMITLANTAFDLVERFPADLAGEARWTQAGIQDPVRLDLGEVTLVLGSEDRQVVGTLRNDGETALSGRFTLAPSGRYQLSLELNPGREADPNAVELLRVIAQPRPGGGYLITDSGTL